MPQFTDGFAILNVDPGALKGRLDSHVSCSRVECNSNVKQTGKIAVTLSSVTRRTIHPSF